MYWLRKSKKNIIGTFLQGGQGNLSGKIVTSLMIDCPNYEEQKKIGKLLMSLDNLITLHQRKFERRLIFAFGTVSCIYKPVSSCSGVSGMISHMP